MKKITLLAVIIAGSFGSTQALAKAPAGYASSAELVFDISVPKLCGVAVDATKTPAADFAATYATLQPLGGYEKTYLDSQSAADDINAGGLFAVKFKEINVTDTLKFKPITMTVKSNSVEAVKFKQTALTVKSGIQYQKDGTTTPRDLADTDVKIQYKLDTNAYKELTTTAEFIGTDEANSTIFGKEEVQLYLDMGNISAYEIQSGFHDRAVTATFEVTCG